MRFATVDQVREALWKAQQLLEFCERHSDDEAWPLPELRNVVTTLENELRIKERRRKEDLQRSNESPQP